MNFLWFLFKAVFLVGTVLMFSLDLDNVMLPLGVLAPCSGCCR